MISLVWSLLLWLIPNMFVFLDMYDLAPNGALFADFPFEDISNLMLLVLAQAGLLIPTARQALTAERQALTAERQALTAERQALSIEQLDQEGHYGFAPIQTSQDLNWRNLFALISLSQQPDPEPVEMPAFQQAYIILHIANPVNLAAYLDQKVFRTESQPGMFSIIPSGMPMKWQVTGDRGKVLAVFLQPDFLKRFTVETLDMDSQFADVQRKLVIQDPLVQHLCLAIKGEMENEGASGLLYVDALSQALGAHLIRKYGVYTPRLPDVKGRLAPATFRRVLAYIDEHFTREIGLTEIARVAHLSEYHFARLFKQTVGVPVYQYVLHKRMECGKELLLSGKYNVTQAALHTGFSDTSHFSRHFKRHFGVTPRELTKNSNNIQ